MLHLPTIITSLQRDSSLTAGMQSAAANLQHNQGPHISVDIDQSFPTPKSGLFVSDFWLKHNLGRCGKGLYSLVWFCNGDLCKVCNLYFINIYLLHMTKQFNPLMTLIIWIYFDFMAVELSRNVQ